MGLWSDLKYKMMMKAAEKELKHLPEAHRQAYLDAMKNNPEFFSKIFLEIEEQVKNGKSKEVAGMEIMRKYQGQIQKLILNKK